jgi:flagellar motor switch protein FliM
VPLKAEWEAFELTLREIAALRVGDIIEMPPSILERTRITLNSVPKYEGSVGLDSDRVAVKIVRRLTEENHSHAVNH